MKKIMGLSPIQIFGAIILGVVISVAFIAGTSINTEIQKEPTVITPVPTPEPVYVTVPTPEPAHVTETLTEITETLTENQVLHEIIEVLQLYAPFWILLFGGMVIFWLWLRVSLG